MRQILQRYVKEIYMDVEPPHKFEEILHNGKLKKSKKLVFLTPTFLPPFACLKKTIESNARIINLNYRKGVFEYGIRISL